LSVEKISRWIRQTELKWLPPLQEQCSSLFRDTFLPSHDREHHGRVWRNCTLLLREAGGFNPYITKDIIEGLIVAAWFHDTGMSLDTGPSHGKYSRSFCEDFFRRDRSVPPAQLGEALEAIEYHDSKEKMVYRILTAEKAPGILELLSVADDMDAFGTTGIYRYVEIYLHRGIPVRELGTGVLQNARFRYLNVTRCCELCTSVRKKLHREFMIIRDFFDLYNQQLAIDPDPENCSVGHLGIVNHIRKHCIGDHVPPHRLYELTGERGDGVLSRYFIDLKNELNL
jgi:HD superfamily phosphodiesterase